MSYCNHSTFWDSSDFVSYSLHIFGCFSTPIHVFGTYCILFKTPATMKSVKWHLLNLHFWSCFLDLSFSVLTTPYVLYPSFSGYPLGLFTKMGLSAGVDVVYMMITITLVLVSMVQIFEVRFLIFNDPNNKWRKIRIPWFIFNYLLATTYIFPVYYFTPDQVEGRKYVFEHYFSCVPNYVQYDSVFVLATDNASQFLFIAIVVWFLALQVVLFLLLTGYLLRQQVKKRMSKHTVNLQVKFQRSLFLQILIPYFILVPPVFYLGFSTLANFHFQYLNNVSMILTSSHGFFSTIALIAVQTPYREFVLKSVGLENRFRKDTVPQLKISNFVT